MTTHSPGGAAVPAGPGGVLGPPVADPGAARAACSARVLEREGIPVVLALVDRRPGAAAPDDDPAGEGPQLLALLDRYAEAVAPGAADDDAAALYSVVELIGFAHVHPGPAPASAGGHG